MRSTLAKRLTDGGVRFAVLGAVALALGACASGGDSGFGSSVFVDPSKYNLYNCEQLSSALTSCRCVCRRFANVLKISRI